MFVESFGGYEDRFFDSLSPFLATLFAAIPKEDAIDKEYRSHSYNIQCKAVLCSLSYLNYPSDA